MTLIFTISVHCCIFTLNQLWVDFLRNNHFFPPNVLPFYVYTYQWRKDVVYTIVNINQLKQLYTKKPKGQPTFFYKSQVLHIIFQTLNWLESKLWLTKSYTHPELAIFVTVSFISHWCSLYTFKLIPWNLACQTFTWIL